MSAADVLTRPFEWGAALRHRKLFHPSGVVVSGTLDRLAATDDGLPFQSGPVLARLSKGVGTPGHTADIAGLAWRMRHDTGPWDLLTVSVARVPFGRIVLAPLTSWSNAVFSTLMPLRFAGGIWWVRARIITPIEDDGLGIDTVARLVASGGVTIAVEQACGTGPFRPLARMVLAVVHPDADVSFDPARHEAANVRLAPAWLTRLRRAAYRNSREGRADT